MTFSVKTSNPPGESKSKSKNYIEILNSENHSLGKYPIKEKTISNTILYDSGAGKGGIIGFKEKINIGKIPFQAFTNQNNRIIIYIKRKMEKVSPYKRKDISYH